jgi:hypothetical protein
LTRLFDLTAGRVIAGAEDASVVTQTEMVMPSLGRREVA